MNEKTDPPEADDVMVNVAKEVLVGTSIVEVWEHPCRDQTYALAVLDPEQSGKRLTEPDPKVEAIAAKVRDKLVAEVQQRRAKVVPAGEAGQR